MPEIWLLWTILGAFVLYHGARAFRDTRSLFSPPLIVSLLVFGTLVKSYFMFDDITIDALLDHDYYLMTMVYSALCLGLYSIAFARGERACRTGGARAVRLEELPPRYLVYCVAVVAALGFGAQWIVASHAGGWIAFYSKSHGSAVDFTQISGYIHGMPTFLWAALLIGYVALWRLRGPWRLPLLVMTVFIGCALFLHTFFFGNRNGVIRFCIFLGAPYVFIARPSFRRALPLVIALIVGVAIVQVLPHLREHLHLGAEETIAQGLASYLENLHASGGRQRLDPDRAGHELFFNVGVVQAAFVSGTYDFGAQFAYIPISFIPRFLWPEKPYEVDFGVNYFDLVSEVLGWSPGAGAAICAIGFSFLAFSWLGCVLWAIMGYVSGRAVSAARREPSLWNLGNLCAWLMANIYWGTQGVTAVFAGWFFTFVPFLVLRGIARLRTQGGEASVEFRKGTQTRRDTISLATSRKS